MSGARARRELLIGMPDQTWQIENRLNHRDRREISIFSWRLGGSIFLQSISGAFILSLHL
jgi:hypothetical protein